jgi:hypothetical protein
MPEKLLAPARHETSDVGPAFIWIGVPLVLLTVLALALLVLWLFPKALNDQGSGPVLPQFPNPQLQPSSRESMARFYAEELQQLNGTGWIDKAKGTVHIPIGTAMRKIAEEDIPGWPAPQGKSP